VKDAQRRFETVRRADLPLRLGGYPSYCDETVGRMCWRYDYDPDWTPAAETDRVREGRLDLLGTLEEVHSLIPGDGWVLGLRVRYLAEAGFTNLAQRVARSDCEAESWWCLCLEGFALHRAGWTEEAEEVYRTALEEMPMNAAADWQNLRMVLDRGTRGWYYGEQVSDGNRQAFWAMADPLVITPGNERWVEHMVRVTEARMSRDARNPHNLSWGPDLEELLLRFGPEVGWERMPRSYGSMGPESVVGHEDPMGARFTPPEEVVRDPFSSTAEDWVPEVERPRESYALSAAPYIVSLDYQAGVFLRGDSILVLASWTLPEGARARAAEFDHDWRAPQVVSPVSRRGLFALEEGSGAWTGDWVPGPEGAAVVRAATRPLVLSLESLVPRERMAGRVRYGVVPDSLVEGVAALSDLVLLDGEGPTPLNLDQASVAMAPNRIVGADRSLRLAWEIYGLRPGGAGPAYRLTVVPAGESVFRRAGRWLRIVGQAEAVQVDWQDPPPPIMGPAFRSLDVDLRSLAVGRYRVRLEARLPGRSTIAREVEIELSGAPGGGGSQP
jgi:hypothetical protein